MPKTQTPRRPVSPAKKEGRHSPVTAAELLLEIGVEELPYQFIAPALAALKDSAEQLLKDQRLAFQSARTLGTPRRLTLVVEGLATQQTSMVKEAMGPSKAVAFDQAGQPTRAATGFAAGQGVAVQELQIRQTPKGEYLFAVKQEQGRPATVVLKELFPQLIAKLSFPKAMKWNDTGVRFARPVRWLVALYGGATLPIEAAGIIAGNRTQGHRVLGSAQGIVVRDSESYLKGLERQGVIADPQRRRCMIEDQIAVICKKTGFRLNIDADLLDQAVYTTECPNAIIGSFKEAYLEVPQEILITSMKEHQGFFSLLHNDTGKLVAHFIAVANNQVKDMTLIREGNERVLAARLADAKFFFDEDRKVRLEERGKKLSGVTFHQKLGTMAQKTERVKELAAKLAEVRQDHELVGNCSRAAHLSKADLLTGIVGEFPELQGVMGGEYAKHDGELEAVSMAIREQYLPRTIEGELPTTLPGKILSLADRLDTIVAFFHVGVVPTGSEDPFALRRQAIAFVRILVDMDWHVNLNEWVTLAQELLKKQGVSAVGGFSGGKKTTLDNPVSFIVERLRFYGRTIRGLRDDVMEAVLKPVDHTNSFDIVDLLNKMKALQSMTDRAEFDPLMIGFKRAHRLVEKERWERKPIEPSIFQHPAESDLHKRAEENSHRFTTMVRQSDYQPALEILVAMKSAIDAFFAAVMVNADDPAVRSNRLSLLKHVDDLFMSFADFSQIVVQGG